MTFQNRLRVALARANTTPKALANALGVSVQAVGQVLSGATKALTAENCVRAAQFLSVDVGWLATGDGDIGPQKVESEDMALSQEERDLIVALRVLPAPERQQIVAAVMSRARAQIERLSELVDRNPAPLTVVRPFRKPPGE